MKRCPYCNSNSPLPLHAQRNMESYGNPCKVATECCGRAVYASPVVSFNVEAFEPTSETDDWGDPYTPHPKGSVTK